MGATLRIARTGYALATLSLAAGVLLAARAYPGGFDWAYTVMSSLASLKHNPDGARWFSLALAFSMLLLWPLTGMLRDTAPHRSRLARFSVGALRTGLVFGWFAGMAARGIGQPRHRATASCLCLLVLTGAQAESAAPAAPPAAASIDLEEVQVIGRKLVNLQLELVATQERFYTLYNDLNQNDDFDVFCGYEARTGTKVRKWECKVDFLLEALAHLSQDVFRGCTDAAVNGRRYVDAPAAQWEARRAEYLANVRAVAMASPELKALAEKWADLQAQYDKARKKRPLAESSADLPQGHLGR